MNVLDPLTQRAQGTIQRYFESDVRRPAAAIPTLSTYGLTPCYRTRCICPACGFYELLTEHKPRRFMKCHHCKRYLTQVDECKGLTKKQLPHITKGYRVSMEFTAWRRPDGSRPTPKKRSCVDGGKFGNHAKRRRNG